MTEINISLTGAEDGWLAHVSIVDEQGMSSHEVVLKQEDYEHLCQGWCPPEDLVRASFEFLLQREPKESILARFELPVIGRYFPDYPQWLARHIEGT